MSLSELGKGLVGLAGFLLLKGAFFSMCVLLFTMCQSIHESRMRDSSQAIEYCHDQYGRRSAPLTTRIEQQGEDRLIQDLRKTGVDLISSEPPPQ
jgi:hypothetical protein